MAASLLLGLPSDVIKDVMCQWIEIMELVILDTSIGCKKLRVQHLELLKDLPVDTISGYFSGNPLVIEWALSRSLNIVTLEVNEGLFTEDGIVKSSLHLNTEVIRHIEVKFFLSQSVSKCLYSLLPTCHSLTSILFDDVVALEAISPSALSRLERIEVPNVGENIPFLDNIGLYCRRLVSLRLLMNMQNYDMTVILKLNPHLEELMLLTHQTQLDVIAKHCSSLQKLTLHSAEPVSLVLFKQYLIVKPKTVKLSVISPRDSVTFVNATGRRSLNVWSGSETSDKEELAALLSTIGPVTELFLGIQKNNCEDIYLDWLSHSRLTLTKLDIRIESPSFIERAVALLPCINDLTWFSLVGDCPSIVPTLGRLRYLHWNKWLNLEQICDVLSVCHSLVNGKMYMILTDKDSEGWSDKIAPVVARIPLVEFTMLSGLKSAHSQCQFVYGVFTPL